VTSKKTYGILDRRGEHMKTSIEKFFVQIGYLKMETNLPEFVIYYRTQNYIVEAILLVEEKPGLYLATKLFTRIKELATDFFISKGYSSVHILSLVLTDDFEKARELSKEDTFCWTIDRTKKEMVIFENQVSDFYGLRGKLEIFLKTLSENSKVVDIKEQEDSWKREKKAKKAWNEREVPIFSVTNVIVAVNILLFLIYTFSGDLLYTIGALRMDRLVVNKEYYRLITSLFLHANIEHIFGNMLVLIMAGNLVEKIVGHIKFVFLYFLAGIGGNLLSLFLQYKQGEMFTSLGASGAIFGILGAMIVFVLIRHKAVSHITMPRILFYVLYSIFMGFQTVNIDNGAHIGGLLTGVLITLIFFSGKGRAEKEGNV